MKKKMVALTVLMLLFSVFLVKTEAKGSNDKTHVQVGIQRQEVKANTNVGETSSRPQEKKESNKPKDSVQQNTEKQEVKEVKPKEQPKVNTEQQEVKETSQPKDYIEVDIEKQEISMYVGGKLVVRGPVVTGNVEAGRDTPTGEFSILEKDYDVVLVGADYESHVTYWMQIYGGIGIHDADEWRDEYGGDIYLSDGSHGCINVPLEIVEIIYENAYIGMTVIVK